MGFGGRILKVLPSFGIYRSLRYLATGKSFDAPIFGKSEFDEDIEFEEPAILKKNSHQKIMLYKTRCWHCGFIGRVNASEEKKAREELKLTGWMTCPSCKKRAMAPLD